MMRGIRSTHKKPATSARLLLSMFFVLIFFGTSTMVLSSTKMAQAETEKNEVNPQQLPDSSFIYDVSIIDLSTADAYYDNQTVQVLGEVVGDNIRANETGDHRWITLLSRDSDSNATVSVYMTEQDAEKIDTFGKYAEKGTNLRVRGVYHLTCSDHEGLSDIHAEYVAVSELGEETPDELDPGSFISGAVLVCIGLVMLLVFYRIREGRR